MKRLKKIFTWVIVLYPLISVYSTGIPSLSIADAVLIVLSIALLFNGKYRIKIPIISKSFALFLAYILLTFIIQIICWDVSFFSTLRYSLFLVVVICFQDYFDFEQGIKLLGIITIVVSVYVILQYMSVHMIGRTLPWRIPGLPIMDNNFILKEQTSYYLAFYRPTGVFCEPTHYSQYCLIYPCYLLFAEENINRKKWISIVIIVCGIICSGSSAGLFMLAGIFCFYYVKYICKGKINVQLIVLTIMIVFAGVYVVKSPELYKIVSKLIPEDNSNISVSVGYRFNSIANIFNGNRSFVEIMFGSGRGSQSEYFTAIFYILYAHGFVGLILFVNIFMQVRMHCGTSFQKVTLWIVLLMAIGSEMVVNFGIMTYFIFILTYQAKENNIGRIGEMI